MALGMRVGGQVARLAMQAGRVPVRQFSEMPLTFASPTNAFYAGVDVKQIDVPTFSGAFGILPKHVPTMAALKPGVVEVTEADGSKVKYFVSSGQVTVNGDSSVQLLAEEACLISDIDINAAREALNGANAALSSAKDETEKAEAAIKVEAAEAVIKAVS